MNHPDFLNVRKLAILLAIGPFAVLLLFGAIELSRTLASKQSIPNNGSSWMSETRGEQPKAPER